MEVAAGYAEDVDVQVGRLIDEVEALGNGKNTLIFYVWGETALRVRGKTRRSVSCCANGIPTTVKQHIAALDALGGLDVLGTPPTDNQYHAGWAWAGSTPTRGRSFLHHTSVHVRPDGVPLADEDQAGRDTGTQLHHCNDLVPTLIRSSASPRRGR